MNSRCQLLELLQIIRREGFKQVDSVMLVVKRPTNLETTNAYTDMLDSQAAQAAHLSARIKQGEVSLITVGNQCDWLDIDVSTVCRLRATVEPTELLLPQPSRN